MIQKARTLTKFIVIRSQVFVSATLSSVGEGEGGGSLKGSLDAAEVKSEAWQNVAGGGILG